MAAMRDGGQLHTREIQHAMLWLDLHAAGVRAEMAEEKFNWFGEPATKAVKMPELPQVGAVVVPLQARVEKVQAEVVPLRKAPVAAVGGRVWSEGEKGGVVIALEGGSVPAGRARELLARMLASVGLKDDEVSWVGIEGAVEASAVAGKMAEMAPARVLVLGQNVLGAWLGKKLGVEGWQAAPCGLPGCEGVVVGVTYPPVLLLAQPLFKRLAWQHLLAWKMVQAA